VDPIGFSRSNVPQDLAAGEAERPGLVNQVADDGGDLGTPGRSFVLGHEGPPCSELVLQSRVKDFRGRLAPVQRVGLVAVGGGEMRVPALDEVEIKSRKEAVVSLAAGASREVDCEATGAEAKGVEHGPG